MESKKRQTISLIIIIVLVIATIGLLRWSNQPIRVPDDTSIVTKPKEKKAAADLFSDPHFQELRQGGGTIDVGAQGNENPFEPFQ